MPDDAVSDDEDDEWADEGAEFTTGNEKDLDLLSGACHALYFQRLLTDLRPSITDMLAGGGLSKFMDSGDDDENDEDDQDLQDDPIWQLDLHVRLA